MHATTKHSNYWSMWCIILDIVGNAFVNEDVSGYVSGYVSSSQSVEYNSSLPPTENEENDDIVPLPRSLSHLPYTGSVFKSFINN